MGIDTKEALLDSAENAVRGAGYDGFSYADLAQEVGIRKASIHYHFPTKAQLALALMKRYNRDLQAQLQEIDKASAHAGARLQGQIDRNRAALQDGTKLCLCVAFSISADHLDSDLIGELKQFRNTSIDWLEGVFELGQADGSLRSTSASRDEAAACLAVLEGGQLAARAESDIQRFDEAVKNLQKKIVTA